MNIKKGDKVAYEQIMFNEFKKGKQISTTKIKKYYIVDEVHSISALVIDIETNEKLELLFDDIKICK